MRTWRELYQRFHGEAPPPPLICDFVYCRTDEDVAADRGPQYIASYLESVLEHYEIMSDHFEGTEGYAAYAAAAGALKRMGSTGFLEGLPGRHRPRHPLVEKQTRRNARLYGMADRGVLAPGMRADLNVIDLDGLQVRRPRAHADLPAGGGWRFLQPVRGYLATVVAGVQTRANDTDTGERPGRLLRRG